MLRIGSVHKYVKADRNAASSHGSWLRRAPNPDGTPLEPLVPGAPINPRDYGGRRWSCPLAFTSAGTAAQSPGLLPGTGCHDARRWPKRAGLRQIMACSFGTDSKHWSAPDRVFLSRAAETSLAFASGLRERTYELSADLQRTYLLYVHLDQFRGPASLDGPM